MSCEHQPVRSEVGLTGILLIVAGIMLWLILSFQFLIIGPRLQRTFDEFGMKLPEVSRAVVDTSMAGLKYWWISLPAVPAVALVYAVAVAILKSRARWARISVALAWVFILMMIVSNLVVAASLYLPWRDLQRGLEK